MALAEGLKSNTTLKWFGSAALPANPPFGRGNAFVWPFAVTCVNPPKLAPARCRLGDNALGDEAEQALRAAAGSHLQLDL